MTPQEAINQLNDLINDRKSLMSDDKDYNEIYQHDIEALEMAIQVLEKQIPKKPKDVENLIGIYVCPCCETPNLLKPRYCKDCGQAID